MTEPWWVTHARETGHDTIYDDRGGMSCSDCPALPPVAALKWVDLFGIDPDYCDGKPVDEWLEESRGEA